MAYNKSGFIDLGPIKDRIPVNDGVMPVDYGFIEGTFNKDDGDEVDVIVFSEKSYKTGDKIEINIVGMLTRADGDNKIIAHDNSLENFVFDQLPELEKQVILDYMGYIAQITSIDNGESALAYVKNSTKRLLSGVTKEGPHAIAGKR
ncbi:MAG: inorganic diphosphatase [Candidatus Staskawiczbacteria bacterium]|nr:inorganic diphosphatase [Candidatus Staskawiczbacteria bacterium]